MINQQEIEGRFLFADKLMTDGSITECKHILEEILEEEPAFGRAHNHLGWIYATFYNHYEKAEKHYKFAIRFSPEYPSGYLNYAYLLNNLGRTMTVRDLLAMASEVPGIDKSRIFNEFGIMHETEENYKEAILHYKKAIKLSFNQEDIKTYLINIDRCYQKKNLFFKWFSRLRKEK